MSALPTPPLELQFFDATGIPLAGGLVYTYQSGTNTAQATYTDATATVPNANPIVLNAGGFPSDGSSIVGIWLLPSVAYRFTVADANNVPLYTVDNIAGLLPTSSGGAVTQVTATAPFTSSGGSAPNISAALTGNGSAVQTSNVATSINGQVATYDGHGNVGNSATLLSAVALLASPTFTGTPSGPTPGAADNSTHLETTAGARTRGKLKNTTIVTKVNPGAPADGQTISVPSTFISLGNKIRITFGMRCSAMGGGPNPISVYVSMNGGELTPITFTAAGDMVTGDLEFGCVSASSNTIYQNISTRQGGANTPVAGPVAVTTGDLTGAWTLKTTTSAVGGDGSATVVFDYLTLEVF